jgi:hypothetical protein
MLSGLSLVTYTGLLLANVGSESYAAQYYTFVDFSH